MLYCVFSAVLVSKPKTLGRYEEGDDCMTLIPCDCDCVYQKEGYCNLEKASVVTNVNAEKGCVYYIAQEKESPARESFKSLADIFHAD